MLRGRGGQCVVADVITTAGTAPIDTVAVGVDVVVLEARQMAHEACWSVDGGSSSASVVVVTSGEMVIAYRQRRRRRW